MRPDMDVPKWIFFGHLLHSLPHDDLGLLQAVKDFSIKEVVSKGAIKAFTKAILPRAIGFNVSGFDPNAR
jgi:hypothetical protein